MKNTGLILVGVIACSLAGCGKAAGPRAATPVLLEDQVKVRVDDQGRPTPTGGQVSGGDAAGKAP